MNPDDDRKVLRLTHRPKSNEFIPVDRCVFLKGYEPMTSANAAVEFTENLEDARTFASLEEMQTYVRQVDPEEPMRSDGRPNRPVSAFSMDYCPVAYFARTTTGWSMREEHRASILERSAAPGHGTLTHFLGRPLLEHEIRQLAELAPQQHIIVLFEPLNQNVDPARSFVTRANKLTAIFDAYHQGRTGAMITMLDRRTFDLREIKVMVAIPSENAKDLT